MTLNDIIKLSTKDKNLRNKLLNNPVETLRGYGVMANQSTDSREIRRFPESLPQGGEYRP